jgi:hypothetical protein
MHRASTAPAQRAVPASTARRACRGCVLTACHQSGGAPHSPLPHVMPAPGRSGAGMTHTQQAGSTRAAMHTQAHARSRASGRRARLSLSCGRQRCPACLLCFAVGVLCGEHECVSVRVCSVRGPHKRLPSSPALASGRSVGVFACGRRIRNVPCCPQPHGVRPL